MAKNVFNVDVENAEIDPAAVVGTQYLDFEDRLKKLAEIIDAQRAKIKALKDDLKAETRTLDLRRLHHGNRTACRIGAKV